MTGPEEQQQPLSAVSTGERLLDATWSPRSDGVLVLSRLVSGGPSYELSFLQTDGQLRDLAQLPGEPIAGSWVWAPDGGSIAFLVHTTTVSLVTLDIQTGTLRYLDDLGADALPSSGAIAPAAWEPSGGLLYAGPARPSGSGGPVLHEVATGRTDAHRLGDVDPAWAPAVANEGVLFTLARRGGDELVLRPVDGKGHVLGEQPLGIQVSGAFSARWDFAHRQLLIAELLVEALTCCLPVSAQMTVIPQWAPAPSSWSRTRELVSSACRRAGSDHCRVLRLRSSSDANAHRFRSPDPGAVNARGQHRTSGGTNRYWQYLDPINDFGRPLGAEPV